MKELEFPLKGTITYDDVKKAQDRILSIAVLVRDIFKKHSIPYTIMFGTLLGAVRHKGFIPWDLDFDFAVPEEYYDTAMEYVSNEIPEWVVVQNRETDPFYCAFWSKIVDKNSKIVSTEYASDNLYLYNGLHIDIYKLKRTSMRNYETSLLNDNIEYYEYKHAKKLLSDCEYNKTISNLKEKKQAVKLLSDDTECFYFLHLFKSEATNIFPTKTYSFGGFEFNGPHDFDATLKCSYYKGDYMVPPPYEKRDLKVNALEVN